MVHMVLVELVPVVYRERKGRDENRSFYWVKSLCLDSVIVAAVLWCEILEVWNGRRRLSHILSMRARVGMRMILLVFNYNNIDGRCSDSGVVVHGGESIDGVHIVEGTILDLGRTLECHFP
eukprot:11686762-Ditylum_brightwellii.AAC.1